MDRSLAIPASIGRKLLRRVYTNNPFYLISAGLVFWGLRMSFNMAGSASEAWVLTGSLAGYTLLLAATAWGLIRLGQVWDDVRTLLLLVVLMLLATSLTFDVALIANRLRGTIFFLGGLVFAVTVSEALLRGLKIALPWLYRAPYYAAMALFFLYPLVLAPLTNGGHCDRLSWALFLFPVVAAAVGLGLLPAVRRGAEYVRHNGTPWRWPLFPWTLFGVLGFCAAGRTSFLCISFDPSPGTSSIYGPYFLAPLFFAIAILLLEGGIVSRRRMTQSVALAMPVGVLLLSTWHRPDRVYDSFLQTWTATIGGTPMFAALVASCAFFAYAWLRRVRFASTALTASMAAMSVIGPQSLDASELVDPRGWPIVAAALVQFGIALAQQQSWRAVAASCGGLAGMSLDLQGTWFANWAGFAPRQLFLVALLATGLSFRDRFARSVKYTGALLLVMECFTILWGHERYVGDMPAWLLTWYPVLAAIAALAYGKLAGHRGFYAAASACAAGWLGLHGSRLYGELRTYVVGLDQIALGVAFFLIAALISFAKIGIVQRWLTRLRTALDARNGEAI